MLKFCTEDLKFFVSIYFCIMNVIFDLQIDIPVNYNNNDYVQSRINDWMSYQHAGTKNVKKRLQK